jgi:hypothetical protein
MTLKSCLTISAVALVCLVASAKHKQQVADYPLLAHVVSVERHHGRLTFTYVRLKLGNLIYITGGGCHKMPVGSDVHARIEREKNIFLLSDDGRSCKTNIEGTAEAEKP